MVELASMVATAIMCYTHFSDRLWLWNKHILEVILPYMILVFNLVNFVLLRILTRALCKLLHHKRQRKVINLPVMDLDNAEGETSSIFYVDNPAFSTSCNHINLEQVDSSFP